MPRRPLATACPRTSSLVLLLAPLLVLVLPGVLPRTRPADVLPAVQIIRLQLLQRDGIPDLQKPQSQINSGEQPKLDFPFPAAQKHAGGLSLRLCLPRTLSPEGAPDPGGSLWPGETDPAEGEGTISPVCKEQNNPRQTGAVKCWDCASQTSHQQQPSLIRVD